MTGAASPEAAEDPCYDELRRVYLPDRVRLLLIGESVPNPGATERLFFYAPTLDKRHKLFRRHSGR